MIKKKSWVNHPWGCFETVNCKGVILEGEEEIKWIKSSVMLTIDREINKMQAVSSPSFSHDTCFFEWKQKYGPENERQ